ncbi:hypothetical protein D3C78_19980 [compost metagenome]
MFNVKKPCADCPFLKDSTMNKSLHPERLSEITEELLKDDHNSFSCHKTVNYDDTSDKTNEQQCFGSMVYLQKIGRPNVAMRLAYMTKHLDYDTVKQYADKIIEDPSLP